MTTAAHFDELAPRYDELRPADASWWRVYDAIAAAGDFRGRRVLEVGAGTGQLAHAVAEREAARVWAVDASAEMVARARANGVDAKRARAEALPFKAGWFERCVFRMSLHVLDRPRALAEAARVLRPRDGRVVAATTDPEQFGRGWFDPYLPSAAEVDRARFPSAEELDELLRASGFRAVRVDRLVVPNRISRERALGVLRGRAFSTFALLPADELADGLARAEAELPAEIDSVHRWLIASAER
jgi:ubiquinone/menaquinone biosynthesis C-methylase UbiE